MRRQFALMFMAAGFALLGLATYPVAAQDTVATPQDEVRARIAWYGSLDSALAEAKRSNRPILFVSGAPQCLGVPGIW